MVEVVPRTGLLVPVETPDSGVRTITLGGTDAEGNPLPPTGIYYVPVPGGRERPPTGLVPYVEPQAPGAPGPDGAPAGLVPYQEPQGPQQAPQAQQGQQPMGAVPAAGYGALHGATFGAYPALAGLAGASGLETGPPKGPDITVGAPDQSSTYQAMQEGIDTGTLGALGRTIAAPFVGGYHMLTGGQDRVEAYQKARQEALDTLEKAKADQPGAYLAGEVAGVLPTMALPGFGMAGVTAGGRVLQGAKTGALGGALLGTGESVSRNEDIKNVLQNTALGGAAGAVLGAGLGSGIEATRALGLKLMSIYRGSQGPEREAARQVLTLLRENPAPVVKFFQDKAALKAGGEAGAPIKIVDVAGEPGRRRLRAAINLAPEAGEIAGETLGPRYRQQADRISGWIASKFKGGDVDRLTGQIKTAAKIQNKPNYQRAQAVAEKLHPQGIWSEKLDQLAGADAVGTALQTAMSKGSNRAVAEGMGAFNPRVGYVNGRLVPGSGKRGTSFPDLQLWDYTQRALGDLGQAAKQAGRFDEADAIFALKRQLLAELDRLVPAFAQARGVAATFFKASDALEAGANFVTGEFSNPTAARMIAQMAPAERELFRRGFATELTNRIREAGARSNVIEAAFLTSPNARQRIEIALGKDGAAELEALLRLEQVMQRAWQRASGNSTTMMQAGDVASMSAAGNIGAEIAKTFNPVYFLAGALTQAGVKGAKQIDERVATEVAKLLLSDDPALLQRGLDIVTKQPIVREALRRATDVGIRETISNVGPAGTAAGLIAVGRKLRPGAAEPPHPQEQRQENENQ